MIRMPRFLRSTDRPRRLPSDFDPSVAAVCREVAPFTMTSPERIAALVEAVRHVSRHAIAGDIVECGVWRGGSMLAVARTLLELGERRRLHLFDTFDGMPPPGAEDRDRMGVHAANLMAAEDWETGMVWARSPLEEVRRNVLASGYPETDVRFVRGRVEETIPDEAPDRIAILRLDTDWYESTRRTLAGRSAGCRRVFFQKRRPHASQPHRYHGSDWCEDRSLRAAPSERILEKTTCCSYRRSPCVAAGRRLR